MMYDIASAARLSKSYTNVDIRATSWDNLQEAILEFTDTLRMGYRKNASFQLQKQSTVTTTVTTTGVVNKLEGQQPKTQQGNVSVL